MERDAILSRVIPALREETKAKYGLELHVSTECKKYYYYYHYHYYYDTFHYDFNISDTICQKALTIITLSTAKLFTSTLGSDMLCRIKSKAK